MAKYLKPGQTLTLELIKEAIYLHENDVHAHKFEIPPHDHPVEEIVQEYVHNHTHDFIKKFLSLASHGEKHENQHIAAFAYLGMLLLQNHTHPPVICIDRGEELIAKAQQKTNYREIQILETSK